MDYTVISLFAGCGGSSLGYKWAGFKELLAVEWDKHAVECFKLNFPEVPIYFGDITKLSIEQCLHLSGLQIEQLDILDGSPPCQGFSTAGKRQINDDRNNLFKEYCRLLLGLQPKVFVMENVSGMIKGKMKGKFLEILQILKDCGYQVKCKLMNAMWYEVPQSRERLIFIGLRNDLNGKISYPEKKNQPIKLGNILDKKDCHYKKVRYSEKRYGDVIVSLNKPCQTITKLSRYFLSRDHYLTISQLLKIGSFPDDFKMNGSESEKRGRIGNSVPPKMMYHIAKHIKETILQPIRESDGKTYEEVKNELD